MRYRASLSVCVCVCESVTLFNLTCFWNSLKVSYVIKLNLRGILHFEFKQPLDHEIQIYRKSKWVMIFLIAQPIETNLDKKFLILVVEKYR